MHPVTLPIICLLGVSAGKSKRKRKKASDGETVAGETNGSGSKTRAQRIMEIQNGLARENKARRAKVHATQSAQVVAAAHNTTPAGAATTAPPRRRRRNRAPFQPKPGAAGPQGQPIIERMGAEIVISPDGTRGFVGARWWAETGRTICAAVREANPEADPAQVAVEVLSRVKTDVDWENPAMPAGVKNVLSRVERFVQASLAPRASEPAEAPVQGAEAPDAPDSGAAEAPFSFAQGVAEGGAPQEPIPPGVDLPHDQAAAAPRVPGPGDEIPPGTYWEPGLNRYVPPGDPEYNPAKAPQEAAPPPEAQLQAPGEQQPAQPKQPRSRRGNRGGKGKGKGKGKGSRPRNKGQPPPAEGVTEQAPAPAVSTEVVTAPPPTAQSVGTGDSDAQDAPRSAGGDGTGTAPEAS